MAFVGGADDMMLIAMQSAPDRIDATLVDAASDFTLADLQENYEAVIVSPLLLPIPRLFQCLRALSLTCLWSTSMPLFTRLGALVLP